MRNFVPVRGAVAPILAAVLLCALVASRPAASWAVISADDASDVCPAASDPCVVTEPIAIADGAVLDFGVRALEIQPSGKLSVASGETGVVRCGNFDASSPGGVSIATNGSATADGGRLIIEARGRCGGDGAPCVRDADCGAATCAATTGQARLRGEARVGGAFAGSLDIRAAGDVLVQAPIFASSSDVDADGGAVTISSGKGSVRIDAAISALSGRSGFGGEVDLTAAQDVIVGAEIDVSGGEFDGGALLVEAGRDVLIGASVHASATRLDGAGGEINVSAARDVRLGGGALLESNGGRAGDFAGDGGVQVYSAGGIALLDASVVISTQGARPDGAGGSAEVDAGDSVTIEGSIAAGALGAAGQGGFVTLTGCEVTLATGAVVTNAGDDGENVLTGRGAIVVAAGSELRASAASGLNQVIFGDADLEPVIQGTVIPAAFRTFDGSLGPCVTPTTTVSVPTTTTTSVTTTLPTTTSSSTTTTITLPGGCGDGVVQGAEECDGGGEQWRIGSACRRDCTLVDCGDPDDSGRITAVDALFILRCAIGSVECASCICDVDTTGGPPKAGDALRVLRVATGLPQELICPACS